MARSLPHTPPQIPSRTHIISRFPVPGPAPMESTSSFLVTADRAVWSPTQPMLPNLSSTRQTSTWLCRAVVPLATLLPSLPPQLLRRCTLLRRAMLPSLTSPVMLILMVVLLVVSMVVVLRALFALQTTTALFSSSLVVPGLPLVTGCFGALWLFERCLYIFWLSCLPFGCLFGSSISSDRR